MVDRSALAGWSIVEQSRVRRELAGQRHISEKVARAIIGLVVPEAVRLLRAIDPREAAADGW